MKKFLAITSLLILLIHTGCNKEKSEDIPDGADSVEESHSSMIGKAVAMYRAAVYKDAEHKNWLATLNKGEQVEIIEEISTPVMIQGKENTVSKIRLSDNSIGYVRSNYLARDIIAIIEDNVPVYTRNNKASGLQGRLPLGTLAFILEENGKWIKITAGQLPDGAKIYSRWLDSGYTREKDTISQAILIDQATGILSGKTKGDKEEAKNSLEEIANSEGILAGVASKMISGQMEEEKVEETYVYPENSVMAKVIASSLRVRNEPSVDGSELFQIGSQEDVAIIEEKEETVEVAGKMGKWTRINFKGKEGWAFGAFLEKTNE